MSEVIEPASSSALATIETTDLVAVFTQPNGVEAILLRLEADARAYRLVRSLAETNLELGELSGANCEVTVLLWNNRERRLSLTNDEIVGVLEARRESLLSQSCVMGVYPDPLPVEIPAALPLDMPACTVAEPMLAADLPNAISNDIQF